MGPESEQRLTAFLHEHRNKPFQWHVWDCFHFTNEGWRAMHGHGWADELAGRYTKGGLYLKLAELKREFGAETIEEALGRLLTPVGGIPPRGALVVHHGRAQRPLGASFGLAAGTRAAFAGKSGIEYLPISQVSGAWV
jgi:hypothetical protein